MNKEYFNNLHKAYVNYGDKIEACFHDVPEAEWKSFFGNQKARNYLKLYFCGAAYALKKEGERATDFWKDYNPGWTNFMKAFAGNKANQKLIKALSQFPEDALLGYVLEADSYVNSMKSGLMEEVEGINELALQLLAVEEEESILDMGARNGAFMIKLLKNEKKGALLGSYYDQELADITQLKLRLLGLEDNVFYKMPRADFGTDYPAYVGRRAYYSIKEQEKLPSAFMDKIFLVPTVGLKGSDYPKQVARWLEAHHLTCRDSWGEIVLAWTQLKETGKMVALVNNGTLQNADNIAIREYFVNQGYVEAVISLPDRLMKGVSSSFSLLVLSHHNEAVKLIDGREFFTKRPKANELSKEDIDTILAHYELEGAMSKHVSLSRIGEEEYNLLPSRYFFEVKDMEGEALEHICKVTRGSVVPQDKLDDLKTGDVTDYKYLYSRDMDGNIIDVESLPSLDVAATKRLYDKKLIHKACVLITKNAPYKISLVQPKENEHVLVNGNAYILDLINAKMNIVYLLMALKSAAVETQMEYYSKGSVIKTIALGDIKQLKIKRRSIEEEHELADKFMRLERNRQELKRELVALEDAERTLIDSI